MHASCIPGTGYRMIAFLTLFLGIATGVHTVELSASPGVSLCPNADGAVSLR